MKMDQKEFERKILVENSDMLAMLSNQLGRYIQAGDSEAFCILVKAINSIIDSRQLQLVNTMNIKETADNEHTRNS
jgi:hypothetical protein